MIKITKIISIGLVAVAMIASMIGSANALGSLSFATGTVFDLATADLTVTAASTANGLVINADSIVVTIAAGDSFTVANSYRKILIAETHANVTTTIACTAGTTTSTATIVSTTGTGDYTLTFDTGACPYSSGGGGGGSSEPTPTPTPTPIPTVSPTPTPTPTPVVSPGPATPDEHSRVTLYRVEGDHRVYVIKEGKKNWIKTAEEFVAAGYNWSDIVVTTPAVMAGFPDLTPSGVILYRAEGDVKVYIVTGNVKKWIKTAEEFVAAGYNWSDIVVTTPAVVAGFSDESGVTVKVVNTATLRVRKSNTTSSAILGYVKRNEVFTVLEEKTNWYKIQLSNGVIGWISGYYAAKQ